MALPDETSRSGRLGRLEIPNRIAGKIATLLLLPLIVIGSLNAVLRSLGKHFDGIRASNAMLELQWHLYSIVFLLGGGYVLLRNGHVRVDVLYERISVRKRAWVDFLGSLLLLLPFSCSMIWVSIPWVAESWRRGEVSSDANGLPVAYLKTFVPVAFLLLALQALVMVAKQWNIIRSSQKETQHAA